MKTTNKIHASQISWLVALLGIAVCFWCGCATRNVNPPSARPGTGYVDFYADDDADLSWSIDQLEADGGRKRVFFEFNPLEEPILRVALKPGPHRLSVVIINRPIRGPGVVEVEVKDGMVTPVRVTLIDEGPGQISERQVRVGGTAYGRFGRGTRIRLRGTEILRVQTEAGAPLPFQPKPQIPNATESP